MLFGKIGNSSFNYLIAWASNCIWVWSCYYVVWVRDEVISNAIISIIDGRPNGIRSLEEIYAVPFSKEILFHLTHGVSFVFCQSVIYSICAWAIENCLHGKVYLSFFEHISKSTGYEGLIRRDSSIVGLLIVVRVDDMDEVVTVVFLQFAAHPNELAFLWWVTCQDLSIELNNLELLRVTSVNITVRIKFSSPNKRLITIALCIVWIGLCKAENLNLSRSLGVIVAYMPDIRSRVFSSEKLPATVVIEGHYRECTLDVTSSSLRKLTIWYSHKG